MKQCENGHFYDENRFPECPYCEGGNIGKTVAAPAGDIGKTVAAAPVGDVGKTVAAAPPVSDDATLSRRNTSSSTARDSTETGVSMSARYSR